MSYSPYIHDHSKGQAREVSYDLRFFQSEDKRIQIRIQDQAMEFIAIKKESAEGFKAVYENNARHDQNALTGKVNPRGFDQYIAQIMDLYCESCEQNWEYAKQRLRDYICQID